MVSYGGVMYLILQHQDTSESVALVASMTLVSPLKQQTLPKLAFCGSTDIQASLRCGQGPWYYVVPSVRVD